MLRSQLLEREAEARRIELAQTFDELRARATPGHMLDQIVDYASDSGGVDFFRNLRDQTVANPLALGLVGAGLVWLMMSGRDGGRRGGYDPYAYEEVPRSRGRGYLAATRERAGGAMSSAMSGVSGAMSGARHLVSDAGHFVSDTAAGVRDRISDATFGAAHGISGAAHLASDTADSIASTARSARTAAYGTASAVGERAGDTGAVLGGAASALYGGVADTAGRTASGMRALASGTAATGRDVFDFARDQPLVLAGLGLAFGAAMGAAFPATETERGLMGEASEGLKERTHAFAAENYDKSRSMAATLFDEFQSRGQEGNVPEGNAGEGRSGSVSVSTHTAVVPLEEEITEIQEKIQETIRPERIGLRNDRS
jgi:hypothetical protein